jgi:CBS domain-containing protein
MTTVKDLLKLKADSSVYTISPDATVFAAVQEMAEKDIGALPVVGAAGRVVGIVTERDYARKVALIKRTSHDTLVHEIMTDSVLYVRVHHTSDECMALMTENRVRHLIVMNDGKLIGLVSIGDLVKDIISTQKFVIEQLQHYIAGDRG